MVPDSLASELGRGVPFCVNMELWGSPGPGTGPTPCSNLSRVPQAATHERRAWVMWQRALEFWRRCHRGSQPVDSPVTLHLCDNRCSQGRWVQPLSGACWVAHLPAGPTFCFTWTPHCSVAPTFSPGAERSQAWFFHSEGPGCGSCCSVSK